MNDDGLFDLVILYDGGSAVYLNGGTAGNPMFTRAEGVSTNGLDLAQGSLAVLDGLTLDVPPTARGDSPRWAGRSKRARGGSFHPESCFIRYGLPRRFLVNFYIS